MKGFSYRNLYMMRDLYAPYKDNEKLQTLSAQISWSHNIAILSKCNDILEKESYMRMSERNYWTLGNNSRWEIKHPQAIS